MIQIVFRAGLLLLVACVGVLAQTHGTIQGTMTVNTGAVIPGASVTVSNLETGVESTTGTNEVGFYVIPALNPGLYKITCLADSFSSQEFPEIRLRKDRGRAGHRLKANP